VFVSREAGSELLADEASADFTSSWLGEYRYRALSQDSCGLYLEFPFSPIYFHKNPENFITTVLRAPAHSSF
jgi:hypothetical protein